MKKIDYYAVQNPWKMPKWLGVGLGGIFGVIAVGSLVAIVHLTKSDAPPPVAAVAAAPSTSAPVVAAQPKAPVAAVAAANDDDAPVVAKASKRASKRHAAKSKKAAMRLASAKRASDASARATIVARHDTKSKRSDKDALDKLLGL